MQNKTKDRKYNDPWVPRDSSAATSVTGTKYYWGQTKITAWPFENLRDRINSFLLKSIYRLILQDTDL